MSELMSVEWEKWLEQEKTNCQIIEKELDDLSSVHMAAGVFRFKEFWAQADVVSEKIKTTTPLPEDERERLQEKFQRICRDVKKKQSEGWEIRKTESKQKRQTIEQKIREATALADSGPEDMKSLNKAQSLLSEAIALLKEGAEKPGTEAAQPADSPKVNDTGLLRDDRQVCWDKWRKANDMVFGRKQSIWERDYEQVLPKAKESLTEATEGDSFQALEKVKEAQGLLKQAQLGKTQREEIRGMLNTAWETAIGKVNAIRDEKKKKYEDWLGRMEANLQQWTGELQKNKEMTLQLEAEVAQMKDQIQASKSRELMDSLREQMAQKRQKITEMARLDKQLEEKIEAIKAKIGNN